MLVISGKGKGREKRKIPFPGKESVRLNPFHAFSERVNWGTAPFVYENVQSALREGVHTLLREKDESGKNVVLLHLGRFARSLRSCDCHQKAAFYLLTQLNEEAYERGVVLVVDGRQFHGSASSILGKVKFSDVKRGIKMAKGYFPVKVKRILFLNVPLWIRKLVKIAMALLLTRKMSRRIKIANIKLTRKDLENIELEEGENIAKLAIESCDEEYCVDDEVAKLSVLMQHEQTIESWSEWLNEHEEKLNKR
eukprot:g5926.t1